MLGLLDGDGDRYMVAEGPMKGMRGFFLRDANGAVGAVNLGGRRFVRSAPN